MYLSLEHISILNHCVLNRPLAVQVNVPTAQMEEILPAARLLSRATSPSPSDYERARTAFIKGVQEVSLQAQVTALRTEVASPYQDS